MAESVINEQAKKKDQGIIDDLRVSLGMNLGQTLSAPRRYPDPSNFAANASKVPFFNDANAVADEAMRQREVNYDFEGRYKKQPANAMAESMRNRVARMGRKKKKDIFGA